MQISVLLRELHKEIQRHSISRPKLPPETEHLILRRCRFTLRCAGRRIPRRTVGIEVCQFFWNQPNSSQKAHVLIGPKLSRTAQCAR